MCEFCVKHGEGKKWYENVRNYTAEVFSRVNTEEQFRSFLATMKRVIARNVRKASVWKQRFPRIYRLIAYPLVTMKSKREHFGQVVPLEDIEHILDNVATIVRLPCVCRRITLGDGKRVCFGVGMDMTHIIKDLPDFKDFERLTPEQAKTHIRQLDQEGLVHSVWTFKTPFIGGICNCDRDCMAYRTQVRLELGKVMWKAEYVAEVDPLACAGCKECVKRCNFRAVRYDRANEKCDIDPMNCYGCGVCRPTCPQNAITLKERTTYPGLKTVW